MWESHVVAPTTSRGNPARERGTPAAAAAAAAVLQTPPDCANSTPGFSTGSPPKDGPPHLALSHSLPESLVNLDHLELLYHFYTDTCRTLVRTQDQIKLYRDLVVKEGFANPFLMHQILAFSAIHLSIIRPQRHQYYCSLATSLQSRALKGFNEVLPRVDAVSCLPVLLFSHLIALHTFHDIFTFLGDDFNAFMDGLIGCVKLLRGVNLVTQTWWDVLLQSELGSIMKEADDVHLSKKSSNGECSPLRGLVEAADLSSASKEACTEALERLQEYFDVENVYPGDPLTTTNVIFAWFVTASTQYTELVDQRRPEALILLAYYAVLLHRRRKSWVVGDAGQRLLKSITTYLGRRWEQWLVWPQNAITLSTSASTPLPAI